MFSTLSHKRQDFRKKLLNIKYVFWFSLQHLCETFLILRRTARDKIKMCIVLHVKYPLLLSDFKDTCVSSTDCPQILQYQVSWKSVKWGLSCCMRTDGQTDRPTDMTKQKFVLKILRMCLKWLRVYFIWSCTWNYLANLISGSYLLKGSTLLTLNLSRLISGYSVYTSPQP